MQIKVMVKFIHFCGQSKLRRARTGSACDQYPLQRVGSRLELEIKWI